MPEALNLHYDDSSDEEDMHDAIDDNVTDRVNQFNTGLVDHVLSQKKVQFSLSFVNYSYGMMIYNAAKVKVEYKKSKEKNLSKSDVPSDEVISEWIKDGVFHALLEEFNISKHHKASKKLAEAFMANSAQVINEFSTLCLEHKRQLIRTILYNIEIPEPVREKLTSLNATIKSFVEKEASYASIINGDFEPPMRVTKENLYAVEGIRSKLEFNYNAELQQINTVHGWVINESFEKGAELLSPSKDRLSASQKTKKCCDSILIKYNLTNIQQIYIQNIKSLNSLTNPDDFKKEFIKNTIQNTIKAMIDQENTRAGSILQQDHIQLNADITSSNFAGFEDDLEDFIPFNKVRFKELFTDTELNDSLNEIDIKDAFTSALKKNHNRILEPHVCRATLPIMFTHIVASCPEYIASLRLTNRSVLRTVRNQANDTSIFGGSKETNQDFGWQFPASLTATAIERTRITKNARSAIIPIQTGSDAYNGIIERIKTITNINYTVENDTKKITDKDVARWVRQVIQCKPLDFSTHDNPTISIIYSPKEQNDLRLFLVQFAHLLGGTEAMRYPGAIIENQMAIDLILAGKSSWAETLNPSQATGRFIPMTMETATNISRVLMTTYSGFTPYCYNYTGDMDKGGIHGQKVADFTAAEGRLTKSWLEMVQEREIAKNKPAPELKIAIKKSISGWYPGLSDELDLNSGVSGMGI
jgi:hypothetical protein